MTDLAFAYSQLSKFVQYLGAVHLQAAERVLQYVRNSRKKHLENVLNIRKGPEVPGFWPAMGFV